MSRELPEWIGKTDNTMIPRRVRLRVFIVADGRCENCRRRLHAGDKWQVDHRVALVNGGGNRETNLQVLCESCHKPKTVFDVAQKSKTYHKRAKHLGIRQARRTIPGRKFDGTPIPARWR